MEIKLFLLGKTEEAYLQAGILKYTKRLKRYISFSEFVIPALKKTKNLSFDEIKQKEGEMLLKKLKDSDTVVLLD
jgi:23S rRNA (pseudouridine1915-N3)-methyltransferase